MPGIERFSEKYKTTPEHTQKALEILEKIGKFSILLDEYKKINQKIVDIHSDVPG